MTERHGDQFRVYNLSGIGYDYEKFQGKVSDFPWADHHSPPLDTLFRICQDIDIFLKEEDGRVVNIHCLAGKGRTGTVICCYLLYSGRFCSAEDVLLYY
jgi:phosphatidylinositol-3,4,5-trisphosphate 3-phosphatase/dual-specificity protein phosphatase PTEN